MTVVRPVPDILASLCKGISARQVGRLPSRQSSCFEHSMDAPRKLHYNHATCCQSTTGSRGHYSSHDSFTQFALVFLLSQSSVNYSSYFLHRPEGEHFPQWPSRRPMIVISMVLHLLERLPWLVDFQAIQLTFQVIWETPSVLSSLPWCYNIRPNKRLLPNGLSFACF